MNAEEIKEAERMLERDFPLTRIGLCPFCFREFVMVREGGVNRFGFRTEIYYREPEDHQCVWVEVPKKGKDAQAKKRSQAAMPLFEEQVL